MDRLDEQDLKILYLLQEDCKKSAKEIVKEIGSLITTVYAKIKRMEKLGIIKGYHAVLEGTKLNKQVTAFVLISFTYREPGIKKVLSQRDIAKKLPNFPKCRKFT